MAKKDSFVPDSKTDSFVPDEKSDSFVPDDQESILSTIGHVLRKTIEPIPGLVKGRDALAAKVRETLGAVQPVSVPDGSGPVRQAATAAFNAMIPAPGSTSSNPLDQAANAVRNTMQLVPTPDLAQGFIEATVPTSPLDIAGTVMLPAATHMAGSLIEKYAGKIGSGLDAALAGKPTVEGAKLADTILSKVDEAAALPGYAEKFPSPEMTSPFPRPASAPLPKVTPKQVDFASRLINLDRLKDETAQEVIADLSKDPIFVDAIIKQKRGVVPLTGSKVAGEAIGATKEDFAKLKPGESLGKGTLDAQTAAASAMQNMAANDLWEVAKLREGGVPLTQLAERIAINQQAIVGAQGVISEAGRALGAVRLTDAERVALKLQKMALRDKILEDPEKLDLFLKNISTVPKDNIAKKLLAAKKFNEADNSLIRQFQEFRAASLLTNPVTLLLRNPGGNAMAAMSNNVERPLAGMVDFMWSKLTGTKQQVFIGEGTANSYGQWAGLSSAAKDAVDVLVNETSLRGFGAETADFAGAIPGKLGKVIRTPFRILSAGDTLFKGTIASGEMHRLAFRQAMSEGFDGVARADRVQQLLANPPKEMVEQAIAVAKEFTFQTPLAGGLADFERYLKKKEGLAPVAKFFIPFFRTPVNVAKFVAERTPIISDLTKRGGLLTAFLKSGTTREQAVEIVARNIIGTSALTGGYLALKANEGRITGSPPKDREERENLLATGWRPYSIRIGELYVPYRGFEPAASYLGAVADWSAIAKQNPEDSKASVLSSTLASAVKNFVNQPFLTSIKDIMDVLEANDGAELSRKAFAITKNQAASLVPSGLRAIANQKDKTLRDPETLIESIIAKVPILSERVRPRLTRFGEPITRTAYLFGLVDKPMSKADPLEKELREIGLPAVVGFPPSTINGRKLNKDEYNSLLEQQGKALKPLLLEAVNRPGYKDQTQIERITELKKTVSKVRSRMQDYVMPQVELRHLGIKEKLGGDELLGLGSLMESVDYKYLKNNQRREVVNQYIRELNKAKGR